MLYRVHIVWAAFELTTLVVIYTDCIDSCKSNYHTITIMKVNWYKFKYFLQQQSTSLFNEKTMFEQNITYTFWSNFRLWWLNQYCFIPLKSLILVYKYYINQYQMAPMMRPVVRILHTIILLTFATIGTDLFHRYLTFASMFIVDDCKTCLCIVVISNIDRITLQCQKWWQLWDNLKD
jgi:hypothetical protein